MVISKGYLQNGSPVKGLSCLLSATRPCSAFSSGFTSWPYSGKCLRYTVGYFIVICAVDISRVKVEPALQGGPWIDMVLCISVLTLISTDL